MKKSGILNAELMRVITSMGHTDRVVITDSGLPIPPSVLRIDLALSSGVPSFAQTLQAVLNELHVESATVAEEMRQRSPAVYQVFCSSRRRHTIFDCDWSSDVCSSD